MVGAGLGLLAVGLVMDVILIGDVQWTELSETAIDQGGLARALASLGEVMAAVLGLSLTVVAIVVQLASQRYSPQLIDVFLRDRVNVFAISFLVGATIYVVVLPSFVGVESLPLLPVIMGLVLAVGAIGMLVPYFAHVLEFLKPDNIVRQMCLEASSALAWIGSLPSPTEAQVAQARARTNQAVERIADACLMAVSQADRGVALYGVQALEDVALAYSGLKDDLPASWRQVERDVLPGISDDLYDAIVADGTWFETRIFMELEVVERRTFGPLGELVSHLAMAAQHFGHAARIRGDEAGLAVAIRFFNTYVRHALNAGSTRAVFSILQRYRTLAAELIEEDPATAGRIAEYLVYYGRIANASGMNFVAVTVAHDLRILCERAYETQPALVDGLLDLFLTFDKEPETKSEAMALQGVRKAQALLGAFFLSRSQGALAHRIRQDMRETPKEELVDIRDALLAVQERRFWELNDRGFNFDYVDPALRPLVGAFFEPLLR